MNIFKTICLALAMTAQLCGTTKTFSRDPESLVVNLKVIRRNIDPAPGKAELVAHSALLITTDNSGAGSRGAYVLEYMGDGNVYLTAAKPVVKSTDEKTSTMEIEADGYDSIKGEVGRYAWTSQLRGVDFKRSDNHSPEELKKLMEEIVGKSDYDILKHNCHFVQESLRKKLGLEVR